MFTNNVHCLNETTPIYGLPWVSSPAVGSSIIVGFDFGVSCGPVTNLPPATETDTHGRPRGDARNRQMAAEFFLTGTITDLCNGQGCYPV